MLVDQQRRCGTSRARLNQEGPTSRLATARRASHSPIRSRRRVTLGQQLRDTPISGYIGTSVPKGLSNRFIRFTFMLQFLPDSSRERPMMRTVLLILATALTAHAQHNLGANSLIGLNGIGVVIEELSPAAGQVGLRESQLTNDIEIKLRLAGIKILRLADQMKEPGQPYLYANLNLSKQRATCAISLELTESVILARNPIALPFFAPTWHLGALAIAPASELADHIRKGLADLVDAFINDYLWAKSQ